MLKLLRRRIILSWLLVRLLLTSRYPAWTGRFTSLATTRLAPSWWWFFTCNH